MFGNVSGDRGFLALVAGVRIGQLGTPIGTVRYNVAQKDSKGELLDGKNTWTFPATSPSDQQREFYDALDGRAAWFYEAVTNDEAMHGHITGKGQVYMGAHKDQDGDSLDGGNDYVLHLPADVPVETFWSLTAYEVNTRTLINNKEEIGDRSSRMDLLTNKDGSIDIYMGPTKPEGDKAKN